MMNNRACMIYRRLPGNGCVDTRSGGRGDDMGQQEELSPGHDKYLEDRQGDKMEDPQRELPGPRAGRRNPQ